MEDETCQRYGTCGDCGKDLSDEERGQYRSGEVPSYHSVTKPQCNHVWRNGASLLPAKTESDLRGEISLAGIHGYWLRGGEPEIAKRLIENGYARMCEQCGKAVFSK